MPQRHICASSFSSRLLVYSEYFFLFSGRSKSPTRKLQCRRFRLVHWTVQIRFIFPSLLVTSSNNFSFLSLLPYFLALAFPLFLSFLLLLLYPQNFSMDGMTSWFLLVSFHALSATLSQRISARPFMTFSHAARLAINRAGNLFFGIVLTLYCRFNLLTSLCALKWRGGMRRGRGRAKQYTRLKRSISRKRKHSLKRPRNRCIQFSYTTE